MKPCEAIQVQVDAIKLADEDTAARREFMRRWREATGIRPPVNFCMPDYGENVIPFPTPR